MNDLEVAILESLHALGGRANIQQIYNRILRSHVTKLVQSGEILRVTRGTYGLTAKGCKRIGIEPSAPSKPSSIEYYVDNEFGGVVVRQVDRRQTSRKLKSAPKTTPRRHKSRPKTVCPVCNVLVRVDRLESHLSRVHPGWRGSAANQDPKSEPTSAERGMEFLEEEVYQSDHESRYGEKHVGQTRRDYDGTFGSIPLYDDYGDESGPD